MATLYERMLEDQARKRRELGGTIPEPVERPRPSVAVKRLLSAEDLALPSEDGDEVTRRFQGLRVELEARGELQEYFVRRVATMTVRVERSVRHESAILSEKVRRAEVDFDAARIDEANRLYDWITADPAAHSRKLRETPEGVDRMIRAWEGLKDELTHASSLRWDWIHLEKAENLMGRRLNDFPVSRAKALSEAIGGEFKYLEAEDAADLKDLDRRKWARERFVELIDAEVAQLEALMRSFNFDQIAKQRAESVDRAVFDASKEATIARRYEAAAERSLYRAYNELRQLQADARVETIDPEPETMASSLPGERSMAVRLPIPASWPAPPPHPKSDPVRGKPQSRRDRKKSVNKR